MRLKMVVSLAACTVILAGCGASQTASQSKVASSATAFKWAYFAGPFMVKAGIQEGYFKKLKVSFTTISTGPGALPLLENGTLAGIDDLGGPVPPIAAARNVGMKIVWVDGSDSEALVANKNITSASQLIGKKIAVPVGSVAEYLFDKYLGAHGVSPSQVDVVNVPPASMAGAFKAGEVSGAWIWAPFWSAIVSEGGHVMGRAQSEDVVGVSSSFVSAHPKAVQDMVCAYYKTYSAYAKNHAATYKAIAAAAQEPVSQVEALIPPSTIPSANQAVRSLLGTPTSKSTLATYLFDVGEWLKGNGSIPTAPSLSTIQHMFDPTFARAASAGKCG